MAETDPLLAFVPPPCEVNVTKTDLVINGGSQYNSVLDPDHCPPQTKNVSEEEATVDGDLVVYKMRWFILAVFSLLSCFHTAAWNTWGPIADTAKTVLNWNDGDIALLANWGCISFVVTAFIFSYLFLAKGLRFCVLSAASFLLLGLGIRCIPVGIDYATWTMHIGQVCIGVSSPVLMAGPTELSAVWFPPHQRTTSTAIATTAAFLGYSLSFLIGPLVVSSIPQNTSSGPVNNLDPTMQEHYFDEIMRLMYIECGTVAIVVIAAMLYFPEKPPTPPSITATKPRDSFKDGVLKMIKSVHFWIPVAAYSITTGVYDGWMTQLVIILKTTLNVGQETVGWIGVFGNIAGTIGGLVVARLVDLIGGRMKAVLLSLIVGCCLSTAWYVLLTAKYISYNEVSLYIACISIGVFVNAAVPIYFEITVEGMYPVSEGNITVVMTYFNNVISLLFLLVPLIPDIGVVWMNWTLLGSVFICLPLLLMYKEHYNRMDLDKSKDTSKTIPPE